MSADREGLETAPGYRRIHALAGVAVPALGGDADVVFADVDPASWWSQAGEQRSIIRNDADCKRIVEHFFGADKPVVQLCHAALALTVAGVVKGGWRASAVRGRLGLHESAGAA